MELFTYFEYSLSNNKQVSCVIKLRIKYHNTMSVSIYLAAKYDLT